MYLLDFSASYDKICISYVEMQKVNPHCATNSFERGKFSIEVHDSKVVQA